MWSSMWWSGIILLWQVDSGGILVSSKADVERVNVLLRQLDMVSDVVQLQGGNFEIAKANNDYDYCPSAFHLIWQLCVLLDVALATAVLMKGFLFYIVLAKRVCTIEGNVSHLKWQRFSMFPNMDFGSDPSQMSARTWWCWVRHLFWQQLPLRRSSPSWVFPLIAAWVVEVRPVHPSHLLLLPSTPRHLHTHK